MKIRKCFVSNSSSSSFVIHKYYLSDEQISKMLNYLEIVEKYIEKHPIPKCGYYKDEIPEYDFSYFDSVWEIKEIDDFIFGETSMDNFDFNVFLRFIGLDNQDNIVWDDGWCTEPTQLQESYLTNKRKLLRKEKLNKLDEI